MTRRNALPELPGGWVDDLAAEVVTPLETGRAAAIAATALGASAGGAGAAVVATHVVAKVIAATALTLTVGGAAAAVAGILPDPIQSFVADLVDGIGIDLPRPDQVLPDISTTIPAVTIPEIPELPLP